jgi:hypothetical protein
MRALKFLSVTAICGLLLASCAGVAHVEKDKTVNFSNYHSYAWVDTKATQNDSAKTKLSDLTERKFREAINAEMAKTGWKEVKHKPDVLLSYDVLVEKTVKDDPNAVYSQPYNRYFYNPYTRRWNSIYYPSQLRPVRLRVRTPPFHGGDTSSNLVRATNNSGKNRFTKGHMPWHIIYFETHTDWASGRIREKYLKTASGKNWLKKKLSGDTGSLPA